jgi:hypothetical protein
MAARWYDPTVGQFSNKDTVSLSPVPNSVEANPFAYVDDNPLLNTDPSGHGNFFSDAWDAGTSWVSNAWDTGTSWVASTWNAGVSWVDDKVSKAAHALTTTLKRINDAFQREMRALAQEMRQFDRQMQQWRHSLTNYVKKKVKAAVHTVSTAYHKTVQVAKATGTFIQHHAAAITSFVVSTAVFIGCEAAVTGLSGGAASLPGVVACGALAGAVGGLITQGAKCAGGQKGACSAGSFLKAGLVGGAVGGLAGAGGALGGRLLSSVGGRALSAVGGLFGRGGTEVAEGAATDAATGAAEGGAESAASSGAGDAAQTTRGGGGSRSGESPAGEQPRAGEEPSPSSCGKLPHSFTGSTPILMADGTTKPIDRVTVGDKIENSVPGQGANQTHTVQKVIVTTTDHDFVDITIAPAGSAATDSAAHLAPAKTGRLKKAALSVAAAAMAATGTFAPTAYAAQGDSAAPDLVAHGATLTTTFHHPFYDQTQAAFVDAETLRVADTLQTPTGTAVVTGLRLYHAIQTTYDLTIDGLHTYYVTAGTTPVLVHNCGDGLPCEGACDVRGTGTPGPYDRPIGTTPAQRASVQGQPCVTCGESADVMVADHKVPLVVEWFNNFRINLTRARSVDAVQPQCPTCSAAQGGRLAAYARRAAIAFGIIDP